MATPTEALKLVFVSNLYPPYVVGGNEMLCADVVTALRSRGHSVSVITGRGTRHEDPDVHGVLEIDLDRKDESFLGGRRPTWGEAYRRHYFSRISYQATRRALSRLRPDVVVVWNLYLASLAPLAAARRHGAPVVTHVADKWLAWGLAWPVPPPDAGSRLGALAFRVAGGLTRPLLRRACRPRPIVAISHFMRNVYVRAGFAPEDVEVSHLGVPTRELGTRTPPVEFKDTPLRLLFVGGLWEGKGPQVAVRALGQLARSGIAVQLDLCGEGTPQFVEWLDRIAAEEGVADRVTRHGFVGREVVHEFMRSADALVFPSIWDEPFAAVPVEAAARGLPIVATTAGGTPEAIDDGVHGLLVAPGDPKALADAVARLANDPGLGRRLGEAAARRTREQFDFDGYVDRLEALYRRSV